MEKETTTEEKVFDPRWENYLTTLDSLDIVEKTKWMKPVENLIDLPFITKNYFPLAEREFLEKLENDESFKLKWDQF